MIRWILRMPFILNRVYSPDTHRLFPLLVIVVLGLVWFGVEFHPSVKSPQISYLLKNPYYEKQIRKKRKIIEVHFVHTTANLSETS
jgi:hypothetical protein